MTLNELKESVLALGFEDRVEDEELFRITAERAQRQLFRDLPSFTEARIIAEMPRVLSTERRVRHGSEDITLPISGLAYSFVSSGVGSYIVSDKNGSRQVDFSSPREEHRGFIAGGEGTITLTGRTAFTLFSLTTFSEISSENVADIPIYTERLAINLSERIRDLLFTEGDPVSCEGFTVAGITVDDGILTLPYGTEGEIVIKYARAPRPLPDSGDGEIDVSPMGEAVLPLLVAAFAWLDDDPDRSQYYMALYRSALADGRAARPSFTEEIKNTGGWA